MVKKILQAPVRVAKKTYKAASWIYKLASGALLGMAIYKGVQKVVEARSVPDVLPPLREPMPEAPEPMAKKTAKKKAVKKNAVKRKPAKKKAAGKRKAKKK